MEFRRRSYGGTRPIFTVQPIQVIGGFNLDTVKQSVTVGDTIPAGTLANFDEQGRVSVVLKTGKVASIDVEDAKIIKLESDNFLSPFFSVGDSVLTTIAGTFADAPTIVKIDNSIEGYIVTLSAEIDDLAPDDILIQVVKDAANNSALISSVFPAMVITDTVVGLDEINVDVTIDTGAGAAYERRILPIPENFKKDKVLVSNHNIKLSNSY